jgi:hypothetical protein
MSGWGMAQVLENLPMKCEALSSNPNTTKKRSYTNDELSQSSLYFPVPQIVDKGSAFKGS